MLINIKHKQLLSLTVFCVPISSECSASSISFGFHNGLSGSKNSPIDKKTELLGRALACQLKALGSKILFPTPQGMSSHPGSHMAGALQRGVPSFQVLLPNFLVSTRI